MLVNIYNDHVAYTFEDGETFFTLGMRFVNKLDNENILPIITVRYNNSIRLVGGTENLKPLASALTSLNASDVVSMFKKFVYSIRSINDSDFIKTSAIDINFNRLYYDAKSKCIKFVLLPVNYECDFHDGQNWSITFRNTLLILLECILRNIPNKYAEVYSVILNTSYSDSEILSYACKYDFGIDSASDIYIQESSGNSANKMILEHNSQKGSLIFVIDKPEFVLGKSKNTADGVIDLSGMISRNHCKIYKNGSRYMIEDLKSTNGTMINGYSLNSNERYYLSNGDKLSLADIEFNVIIE